MIQLPQARAGEGRGWSLLSEAAPWLAGAGLLLALLPLMREFGGLIPFFLIAGVLVSLVSTLNPLIFFSLYYAALFFADTALPGLGISVNQVLAVLFFGSFLSYWARGRALRLEGRWLYLLAAAAAYYAVNAAAGESAERGMISMRYAIVYFALAVCLARCLSTERALLALAWIVAGTTFLAACHGFVEAAEKNVLAAFAGRWTDAVRVRGTAKNSVVYGWNMIFAVPFSFLLYSQLRSPAGRWTALLFGFSAVAVATLTFNRQTYVVIGLVLALSAWLFHFRNRKAVLTAILALGLVGAATVLPNVVRRMMTVTTIGKDPSFLERRDSFLVGMEMFRRHPAFGVGLGSFPDVWKQYIPADYPTYYMQYMEPSRKRFPDFGYMALLAETGLVGFFIFLTLLGTGARAAWTLRRWALEREDWLVVNTASLVFVLVAYVGATSAIQDTLLYPRVWLLFALVLLCDRRIWQHGSKEAPYPALLPPTAAAGPAVVPG